MWWRWMNIPRNKLLRTIDDVNWACNKETFGVRNNKMTHRATFISAYKQRINGQTRPAHKNVSKYPLSKQMNGSGRTLSRGVKGGSELTTTHRRNNNNVHPVCQHSSPKMCSRPKARRLLSSRTLRFPGQVSSFSIRKSWSTFWVHQWSKAFESELGRSEGERGKLIAAKNDWKTTTWATIIKMFRIEPFLIAGTKLKIVSEKKAGIAMNNKTKTRKK